MNTSRGESAAVAPSTWSEAVDALYGLDRDAFIDARREAASRLTSAGDRAAAAQVRKLAKPEVPAWAINQVVRATPALADRVIEVGERLRAAQATFDAALLSSLRPERDTVLDDAVSAATTVARMRGQKLSGAAQAEIRATFIAALADPAASEAALSGCLVKPLSYTGLGDVQIDPNAVAAGRASRGTGHQARHAHARGDEQRSAVEADRAAAAARAEQERVAREAVAMAEQRLRDAETEATAAGLDAAAAEARLESIRARTAELRALVGRAEADEACAAQDLADARADEQRAHAAVSDATQALSWDCERLHRQRASPI